MTHVDVIKNEPLAGVQRRVTTLVAEGSEIHFRGEDAEVWRERIEQLIGPMNAHAPDEYLALLVDRLADATYVSATEPHGDDECPFAHSDEIRVPAEEAAPHLAGA